MTDDGPSLSAAEIESRAEFLLGEIDAQVELLSGFLTGAATAAERLRPATRQATLDEAAMLLVRSRDFTMGEADRAECFRTAVALLRQMAIRDGTGL